MNAMLGAARGIVKPQLHPEIRVLEATPARNRADIFGGKI
jgi:hypothetical protein